MSPSFTLKREDDDVPMYEDEAAPASVGMVIYCLIDTTTGGPCQLGPHSLWVKFDTGAEVPYLGPIKVQIVD